MSDKGKARKLDDRKSVQGQSAGLPPMGPGMVPTHHNYAIPSEGYHSGLAYRSSMGQLMSMGPSLARGLSNDMGPPIFMPSLNLGTPKPPGSTSMPLPPPSSLANSKLKSSSSAFMPDMMSSYPPASPLSAFHSTPLKTVAYINNPSSSGLKTVPVPTTKPPPMPMTAHAKDTITKVVSGGQERASPQPSYPVGGKALKPPSQGVTKLLETAAVKGDGHMLSQSYLAGGHYSPQGSPIVSDSLSKMLMTSTHQQQVLAVSSPGSTVPKLTGGGYSGLHPDPYLVHSPVMVPLAATPPLATSGQPSSNASFVDTRLDRPPQPSAPHVPLSGGPGGMALPKELGQPKERLTTAEVASNIIISNPGLTGKHIAAMTNTTQQQPSSMIPIPHSAYSSPISQSGFSSTEILSGPQLVNMPLAQHMIDSGWFPQHNSNNIFRANLSTPVSMTIGPGGEGTNQEILNQQSNGGGLKSVNIPQSPLGGGGGVQSFPSEQGVFGSPCQTNSSPRPRILRGKRLVDGNWKLDGQTNSMHSPGSPHRTKLQTNLKKPFLTSPSGGETDHPPTSPTGDGRYPFNHMGANNRIEVGENFGSPRKKPRKQNVIANDDQYASNVPDTHHQSEDRGCVAVDESVKVNSSRGERSGDNNSPAVPPPVKELEIRYLSQLRQSPFLINGIYKIYHQSANNHFRRHADIKHREDFPISVYDLANDISTKYRASGWKLYHFSSQLHETSSVEADLLLLMERIKNSLNTVMESSSCYLDREALTTTMELIQGNIDRSNRVKSHIDSTKTNMLAVLDHKSEVLDVLDKYSNFKSHYSSISPSLSSSSSYHKSHS